jgi:SAM-dependent methyltransferase
MTPEELHNIYRAEPEFWWYAGMRAITAALLDPLLAAGAGKGLDAGCGTGYNARLFGQQYGLEMYAIDREPLAIQYCRSRALRRSLLASVTELPFPDNSFDFVSSIDVFPVLPPDSDRQALRELLRVLRPGGIFFLRAAAFRALRSRHSQFVAERHRYRAGELLDKLQGLDCRLLRWTYANALLSPVALLKFRVWENLRRAKPESGVATQLPPWISQFLRAILQAEAALIRRGFRFPFGQSLLLVAQKSQPR